MSFLKSSQLISELSFHVIDTLLRCHFPLVRHQGAIANRTVYTVYDLSSEGAILECLNQIETQIFNDLFSIVFVVGGIIYNIGVLILEL